MDKVAAWEKRQSNRPIVPYTTEITNNDGKSYSIRFFLPRGPFAIRNSSNTSFKIAFDNYEGSPNRSGYVVIDIVPAVQDFDKSPQEFQKWYLEIRKKSESALTPKQLAERNLETPLKALNLSNYKGFELSHSPNASSIQQWVTNGKVRIRGSLYFWKNGPMSPEILSMSLDTFTLKEINRK